MPRKTLAECLYALLSLAICIALSAAAFLAVKWMYLQACSRSSPYDVLAIGLFGMWSVVLFGFLLETAESIGPVW